MRAPTPMTESLTEELRREARYLRHRSLRLQTFMQANKQSFEKAVRFYNPFPGKPAPLQLSGLFLFDPSVILKLSGYPFRSLMAELGGEALYKRYERFIKGAHPASVSMFHDLLDKIPAAASTSLSELKAALEGDVAAQAHVNAMGLWECFFRGAHGSEQPPRHHVHILALERACAPAQRLVLDNKMLEAVEQLSTDPLMSRFLWPEASAIFRRARDTAGLVLLQASLAIELHLSCIAAWDVELCTKRSTGDSFICDVLPGADLSGRNPTALLFRWLMREAGCKSITALHAHPKANGLSLDMVTLKRWSSGSHHPSVTWLRLLVGALFDDADYLPAWARYWGAKHLNMLGFLAQHLSAMACQPGADADQ